ncbi:spider silk-constituting element SpiCE-NMa2A3 [Nephila pilipes]|uniref:Spider silk-constituting element SpiCE-NMa2A3 n=1 Tax=Nephila pilipes TaxID=299642 RepID=A0A8X6R2M3_NEPPI|nr:spider silk-constituting element SpiCE-NMa2A3 [Nephila pilipes]
MKVLIAVIVLGSVLELGNAKRTRDHGPPNTSADEIPITCRNISQCDSPCILDVSGLCPKCDCKNTSSVSCTGPNCKIIRNGKQCSCVCNGGSKAICPIICPPDCMPLTTNKQCACICK